MFGRNFGGLKVEGDILRGSIRVIYGRVVFMKLGRYFELLCVMGKN